MELLRRECRELFRGSSSGGATRGSRFYRVLYIVALFFGSIISLDIIWNIADCMNALMAIPNLVALLLLSGVAARETRKYLWAGRLDAEMEEEE